MKLATFTDGEGTRIGVVTGEALVDLSRAAPGLPRDMRALLERGEPALAAARAAAERAEPAIPLAAVQLEAPVPAPQKFFAIALNYHALAPMVGMGEEAFAAVKREQAAMRAGNLQRWYNKQVTCISAPDAAIPIPPGSDELYFEAELAFVIGRTCRAVSVEEAPAYIAGYTICNDVTEGLWCRGSPTLTFGKSHDGFGPMGPWLVTADEIADPHALRITGSVNGEVQQAGSTRDMIFDCYELVSFASHRCTLVPGDIVTTGMPYAKLLRLAPGDVVRCTVEGIGHIEQRVAAPA